MISVDTSVVVRYFVGSPSDQAARVRDLFASRETIGVSLVVMLEAAHVLRTQYGVDRSAIVDALIDLISLENVTSLEMPKADVIDSLVRARAFTSSPIADALIAGSARTFGAVPVFTFDRRFARLGTGIATP